MTKLIMNVKEHRYTDAFIKEMKSIKKDALRDIRGLYKYNNLSKNEIINILHNIYGKTLSNFIINYHG